MLRTGSADPPDAWGWCVGRPVATTLLTVAVVLAGIVAYCAMPVAALPHVEYPTITVTATLPGASPEAMASSVAKPLERQFATIAGIASMTSTSGRGRSDIRLEFVLGRTIDGAALDVQAALSAAADRLPREMTSRPALTKAAPTDPPVLVLALASETLPIARLTELAQTVIAPRIARISGVAQVPVWGARKPAVRVEVDPDALAAAGISLEDVARSIAAAASTTPVGLLDGPSRRASLSVSPAPRKAEDLRRLIIVSRQGAPVRLGDVATLTDGVENPWNRSWSNGRQGLLIAVNRQFDGNTLAIVAAIKRVLPALRATLPPGARLDIMTDRSSAVRQSLAEARLGFGLAVAAVVSVTLLFLGDWRATIIPAVAVPVSILGGFALMHVLGGSINLLSLLALTVSVGFVVDDTIVVLENIVRHREAGMPARIAARQGAAEVGFTVVSMTLSVVAAFIPVLFATGPVGRLLHEFALSLALAMLVSAVVALTLTPMLAARLQRHNASGRRYTNLAFDASLRVYERSLRFVLRNHGATLALMLASVLASLYLAAAVPKGLFPAEDTDEIWIDTEARPGIAFDAMVTAQEAVAAVVRADPAVTVVNSTVSADSFTHGLNRGFLWVSLKPRNDRRDSADAVAARMRSALDALPAIKAHVTPLGNLQIGGSAGNRFPYVVQAGDLATLRRIAPEVSDRLRTLPELRDVDLDLKPDDPALDVDIDRERAAALGTSAAAVRDALYSAYGPRQVGTIYVPSGDDAILIELDARHRRDARALSHVHVPGNDGRALALDGIATVHGRAGLATVRHHGQLPAATIWFSLAPGASLGDAIEAIEQSTRELDLPAGLITGFGDAARVFRASLVEQAILVVAAIGTIYIVLGMLYESFLHPLTVLSGVPPAACGALAVLLLTGTELNVVAMLGILLLMGISKKNAIMMIDLAIERRRAGEPVEAAIRQACLMRFRPIMMTTAAALAGALPLALDTGAGSEMRRPIGLTMLSGLVVSQFLTLYLSPAVYVGLERARERSTRLLRRQPAAHREPALVRLFRARASPD